MPATNVITSATLSPDTASMYIQDKLLQRANVDLVFEQFGDKATIPTGNSKTTQFVRYERLPLPTAPLVEGETPTATAVKLSTVEAVLDQWGAYISMTDVSQLTVKHPIFTQSRSLIEDQHNELVDREIQVPLLGSSGVTYGGNQASRSALTAADVLTSTDIRRVVSTLRNNGARTMQGGNYSGVVDAFVEQDLNADSTFVNASSYSNITTLFNAEIGKWLGVRWIRSNMTPIISQMASADVPAATLDAAAGGETGFANGSTVFTKVTRLDPTTGFETVIDDEVTNSPTTGTPVIQVVIASTAATGTYRIYSGLEGGATGTPTFQVRVIHTSGTADTIRLIKSGTPSTSATFVVGATGAVAPPNASANGNVHVSYVFGQGHYAVTKMSQGLSTFLTSSGPTKSDPLDQRRTIGWKRLMKAVVLNPNFGRRIETTSVFN